MCRIKETKVQMLDNQSAPNHHTGPEEGAKILVLLQITMIIDYDITNVIVLQVLISDGDGFSKSFHSSEINKNHFFG